MSRKKSFPPGEIEIRRLILVRAMVEIKRAVRQTPSELGLLALVDDNIFRQTSAATVGTASRVSTDSTLLLDREIHCIAMFTLCPVSL